FRAWRPSGAGGHFGTEGREIELSRGVGEYGRHGSILGAEGLVESVASRVGSTLGVSQVQGRSAFLRRPGYLQSFCPASAFLDSNSDHWSKCADYWTRPAQRSRSSKRGSDRKLSSSGSTSKERNSTS